MISDFKMHDIYYELIDLAVSAFQLKDCREHSLHLLSNFADSCTISAPNGSRVEIRIQGRKFNKTSYHGVSEGDIRISRPCSDPGFGWIDGAHAIRTLAPELTEDEKTTAVRNFNEASVELSQADPRDLEEKLGPARNSARTSGADCILIETRTAALAVAVKRSGDLRFGPLSYFEQFYYVFRVCDLKVVRDQTELPVNVRTKFGILRANLEYGEHRLWW